MGWALSAAYSWTWCARPPGPDLELHSRCYTFEGCLIMAPPRTCSCRPTRTCDGLTTSTGHLLHPVAVLSQVKNHHLGC